MGAAVASLGSKRTGTGVNRVRDGSAAMKPRCKVTFLFIVVGGLVAVACVVGIALLAPTVFQKGYRLGSDPEAVAYNYLMALVRQDSARAHGNLSLL